MDVYVAQINWYRGGPHTQEDMRAFNGFFVNEILYRGHNITMDPMEADVIFFVPTWETDKECLDEYREFRLKKECVYSLREFDELIYQEEM